MTSRRIPYGRCSFVPPEGFVVVEKASSPVATSSGCSQCGDTVKEAVSITLTKTAAYTGAPDYSENPEDMNPDAYPVSITIVTLSKSVSPWDYLHETSSVLRVCLNDFTLHFCGKDRIGEYEAAWSQCSFQSNFRIFLLTFAWIADGEFVTATMTVTDSGVGKGWKDLRRFVESVRL